MSTSAPYFKIESFGASDGPGVRLVIFLQGCPWRCLYCHNPESWSMTGNKFISVDEVINRFNKQRSFYRNGGITISGGEPLIHQIFCLELAKRCYQNNIHLAIDTSGATFTKANVVFFNKLIKYHPLFIVDIKQINKTKHKKITGCKTQNEVNLIKFLEFNKQKYWIRQVLVPGYTDNQNDLILLRNFVKKLKWISRFDFLPYHKLALHKYKNLKLSYRLKNIKEPTTKMIHTAKRIVFGK